MAEAPKPAVLRITLQGDERAADTWETLLVSPGTELLRVADPAAARAAEPSLAVFFAPVDGVGAVAEEVARLGLPSTLVLGGDHAHPHTRLLHDLIQAKRDWQGAFDAMVDPIAVVDRRGIVARANLALARALDRPITTVVGADYRALLGSPLPPLADPIARGLEERVATTAEGRYERLPGVRQVTVSLLETDGAVRGVAVELKDVSELREQQLRLHQSARLADVGLLAAGVAHEINTPLASIGLRAESLLRSAQDPRLAAIDAFKNFPRYLATISEEIFRCKRIISALLEFGRPRKQEVTASDLNALATSAADLVGHELRVRRLALELHLAEALPSIRADQGQIRQVLLALLMNAMEATAPGGHLAIETRVLPSGRIALTIRDDGSGIAAADLPRVFSPFFTTKPVGQGTGLGLAICHGIVTGHGGEIRIDSRPGQGTAVTVELGPEGPPQGPGDAA